MSKMEGRTGTIAALGIAGTFAVGAIGLRYIYGSEGGLLDAGISVLTQENCKTKIDGDSEPRTLFDITTQQIGSVSKGEKPPDGNKAYYEYISEQAEVNGLTVVDNSKTLEALDNAANIDELLDIANDFTSEEYGFSVEAPTGISFKDLPNLLSPFDRDNFETEELRKIMKGLTRSLYSVPVEVVELAHVDRLVITDNNSFDLVPSAISPDKSPGAIYYPFKDAIYIELRDDTKNVFQQQFNFTLSAALDISVCGITQEAEETINSITDTDLPAVGANTVSFENLVPIQNQVKDINKKARVLRKYVAPRKAIDLSNVDQQELDTTLLQVLRINEHVSGYANFWKSLTIENSGPIGEIIIDNTLDASA